MAKPTVQPMVMEALVELDRRLKVLESRYTNLNSKTQLTDEGLMALEKDLSEETASVTGQITELKKQLSKLIEEVNELSGELTHAAKKTDVKVLETYLDLWNPIENGAF